MTPDHTRAERDARAWCNDEQSSTGNLARCYFDLRERVTTLEAKQEALRSDMTNALAMVDRMIAQTEDSPRDDAIHRTVITGKLVV